MIQDFACEQRARIHADEVSRRLPQAMQQVARRKLRQLDAATDLAFLRVPPGNRLEALQGTRAGQYSIRVNDHYRLCFVWDGEHAHAVEIIDYH
jgi:proteic killer suppression protein